MTELTISEKSVASQPRKAPMAAMNFTSPRPIASRGRMMRLVTTSMCGIASGSISRSPIFSFFGVSRTGTFQRQRSGSSTRLASALITSESRKKSSSKGTSSSGSTTEVSVKMISVSGARSIFCWPKTSLPTRTMA